LKLFFPKDHHAETPKRRERRVVNKMMIIIPPQEYLDKIIPNLIKSEYAS
jgi:hypothetical protein